MGVAPVDGYGNITSGNAKEIYTKYKRGEVNLSPAQQKYCENFLTPEEIDEVSYDTDVSKKAGSDKINTDGTDKNANGLNATAQTVGTAGALAGTIVAICGGMTKLTSTAKTNGFTSLASAIPSAAAAALALTMSYFFDTSLKDRKARCDEADSTNSTIDGYTSALLDTMDMMNDDMDLYQKQSEEYTLTVNTNTSQMASLQVDLAAAQAAGDKAGVERIKAQMKQIEEMDLSGQTDEMDETKGRLDEYNAANAESLGVSEAGQSVSDFLKQGKGMGALATVNATLATATTALLTIATIVGAIPKIWAAGIPVDGAPAIASVVLWTAATVMMGLTSKNMWSTASTEFKCGSAGDDMQGHIDSLNETIEGQAGYVESTTETFDAADEASTESQGEAKEKANKAVQTNGALPTTPKKDDEDGDKDGGGSPVSAGAAA